MNLNDQLAQLITSFNFPEDVITTIKNTNTLLETSRVAPGLKIGDKAPNFYLSNANGKEVCLEKYLAKGPVVLSFYRGDWCPFCNLELRALQEVLASIKSVGGSLLAISPQLSDKALSLTEKHELSFELLSDPDQKVIQDYKLQYTVPPELQDIYLDKFKIDISQQNADGSWNLPVPATFILDNKGIIRVRHVSMDFTTRMEPENVLDSINTFTYFKAIFHDAPVAISIVNKNGIVIDHNPAINRLFNEREEKSAVGLHVLSDPNFDSRITQLIKEVLTENMPYGEVKHVHVHSTVEGEFRIINFSVSQLIMGGKMLGVICIFNDVTEKVLQSRELENAYDNLKKAHSQLADSESDCRLMALFAEENPAPVLRFDKDGKVIMANSAAKEILDIKSDEEVSLDFVLPGFKDLGLNLVNFISKGEICEHNTQIGDRFYHFMIKGVPEWKVGHIYGTDITERIRIERLRDDTERIVRHDLKNPLNGIIGFSQLLLDESQSESHRDSISIIYNSGYQMLHMINHSLDLFKMEEGSYLLEPQELDLIQLFKKLDQEFTNLQKQKIHRNRLLFRRTAHSMG